MAQWWAPLGLIWLQWLLSAYVLERKLPRGLRDQAPPALIGALIALPLLSLFLWIYLRRIDHRRDGPLMVVWLMTFLFVVHASILAVVAGLIESLHAALVPASGGFFLGFSVLLRTISPGSVWGVNVPALAAEPSAWHRVHHRLSLGFAGTGLGWIAATVCPRTTFLVLALLPAAASAVYAIYTVRTLPRR